MNKPAKCARRVVKSIKVYRQHLGGYGRAQYCEEAVIDLLTDLLHYAELRGGKGKAEQLFSTAKGHFTLEKN